MAEERGDGWTSRVRCRPEQRVFFTRHLAVLLDAGVPLPVALQALTSAGDRFDRVVRAVARRIARGHSLSSAMAAFPRIFGPMYQSMVRVGEAGSVLPGTLQRLADWLERDYHIVRRVRAALTYPGFVLGLTAVLTLVLFQTVLPKFVPILEAMNAQLPLLTRMVMAVTYCVSSPWAWLAGALLGGCGVLLGGGWLRTEAGRCQAFAAILRIPLVGRLLREMCLARLAGALEALLESGVRLDQAYRMAAAASGSPLLAHDAPEILRLLESGGTLSGRMGQRTDLYPATLLHLTAAGEQAGQLTTLLSRASHYFDLEVDHRVETLGAALEPALLALVSVVVGTVVLAVFLPMYTFLGTVGG